MTTDTQKLVEPLERASNYIDALGGDSKAYRVTLAAHRAQQEAATSEPAAYAVYWGLGTMRKNSVHFERKTAEEAAACIKSHTEIRPLFERPVATSERDAKDAARYRVLRNRDHGFVVEQDRPGWRTTMPVGKGLDDAIDSAMQEVAHASR